MANAELKSKDTEAVVRINFNWASRWSHAVFRITRRGVPSMEYVNVTAIRVIAPLPEDSKLSLRYLSTNYCLHKNPSYRTGRIRPWVLHTRKTNVDDV